MLLHSGTALLTCEPSALKWSKACFLSSPRMEPSRRWKLKCRSCKYSARTSNIITICENMSTRWPPSFKRHSSLSNKNSFPLPWMSVYSKNVLVCNTLILMITWRWPIVSDDSTGLIKEAWLQHFFNSITMFTKLVVLPFSPLLSAL